LRGVEGLAADCAGNPSMDTYSMMIMISIGNVVGWLAAMYVANALSGLIGHVVVSTIGAFIGGYLSLELIGEGAKFSMIICAFVGAVLLLYVTRLRNWRS
jgi:uncharacterized membrane protein YeaQ/YmgE (transglycosylase-associated protein family)